MGSMIEYEKSYSFGITHCNVEGVMECVICGCMFDSRIPFEIVWIVNEEQRIVGLVCSECAEENDPELFTMLEHFYKANPSWGYVEFGGQGDPPAGEVRCVRS